MKLHRYVDHQRLHIVTKDVISLSISVLLLFRHYISHKITFGAPSSGGVLCSACGAFIEFRQLLIQAPLDLFFSLWELVDTTYIYTFIYGYLRISKFHVDLCNCTRCLAVSVDSFYLRVSKFHVDLCDKF